MRFNDNNFNYCFENQLTKLTRLVQFKRLLSLCFSIKQVYIMGCFWTFRSPIFVHIIASRPHTDRQTHRREMPRCL